MIYPVDSAIQPLNNRGQVYLAGNLWEVKSTESIQSVESEIAVEITPKTAHRWKKKLHWSPQEAPRKVTGLKLEIRNSDEKKRHMVYETWFQDLSYAITGISCNDRKAFTSSRKYMDTKEEREGVRTDTSIWCRQLQYWIIRRWLVSRTSPWCSLH